MIAAAAAALGGIRLTRAATIYNRLASNTSGTPIRGSRGLECGSVQHDATVRNFPAGRDGATIPVLTLNAGLQPDFTISNNVLLTNDLNVAATTDGTLSGVVSGGGGLTKTNGRSLALSAANTYSGGTTLSAGTLLINNPGAGGISSAIGTGTLTINGGRLQNRSGSDVTLSTNNAQIWGGDFTFGNALSTNGSLNLGTGPVSLTGNRTLHLESGDDRLTVGGAISVVEKRAVVVHVARPQ